MVRPIWIFFCFVFVVWCWSAKWFISSLYTIHQSIHWWWLYKGKWPRLWLWSSYPNLINLIIQNKIETKKNLSLQQQQQQWWWWFENSKTNENNIIGQIIEKNGAMDSLFLLEFDPYSVLFFHILCRSNSQTTSTTTKNYSCMRALVIEIENYICFLNVFFVNVCVCVNQKKNFSMDCKSSLTETGTLHTYIHTTRVP